MKKFFTYALFAVLALGFASCSDDDNNKKNPDPDPIWVGSVYVLSEGSYYSKLDGDLTSYDPIARSAVSGVFKTINERAIAGTANDGLVYGSKLYFTKTDENVVEVCEAKTAKSVKQIELDGARCIKADGGYLYVTMFNEGKVAKIDTTNYTVVATVETDANPEGLTIFNGNLYVANSGYGYGNTVTVVDLADFTVSTTLTVPTNPVDIFTDGTSLYLQCSGEYKADWSGYEVNPAIYTLAIDGSTTKLAEATIAAIGPGRLYFIDNNYYKEEQTYGYIDLTDNSVKPIYFSNQGVVAPCAIGVNPKNGDVYLTAYSTIEYAPGVYGADYEANGFCVRYDKTGLQIDQFYVGINPGTVIFY
ncbi:MAG: hypothetical protein J5729_03550 [Bacteroidaceae bacterium]|nr:hypothetical protein [Bacteroidaceae bacterium]